jgi:cellulose biosynthesis protein BcsQ
LAAIVARHGALSDRVCVVDADPQTLDVSTRLAVGGPALEDFAGRSVPSVTSLGHLHSPVVAVLPSEGAPIGRIRYATEKALPFLKEAFDLVVLDLPAGPSGPGRAVGSRLDVLDWLVLAVTPEEQAISAAAHFLEMFDTARDRGEVGDVRLAVVSTGDESCSFFEPSEIEAILGVSTVGRVPQLWGRAAPNAGFGPALAIPELEAAVYDLFMTFRAGRDHTAHLVPA